MHLYAFFLALSLHLSAQAASQAPRELRPAKNLLEGGCFDKASPLVSYVSEVYPHSECIWEGSSTEFTQSSIACIAEVSSIEQCPL